MSESAFIENSQISLNKEQIEYLTSLRFINNIDQHLRILSSVNVITDTMHSPTRVLLILEIYYDNDKTGNLSFDLHNYDYEDMIELAQNVRDSEFILQEIDNFLSGDVIE